MSMRVRVSLIAGMASLAASLLLAGGVTFVPEVEPNNTAATATPLTLVGSNVAAAGSLTLNDADYYSVTVPAGALLFATVDTGASSASRDSVLTLFDTNGTTVLETDDDDALATDCDGTVDSPNASAISGRLLAGGTYFLRVQAFAPALETISAYKLFVVATAVHSGEIEPNDTPATANPISTALNPVGVRDASISTTADANVYSVVAPAGSTIFISADGDPERNGGTDLVVDLLQPNGTTVILSVDNTDNAGFPPPPAESFCFNVTTSGTYYVRVRGFQSAQKQTTGTYRLMVAVLGVPAGATPTPTPTVTNTGVVGGPTSTPTPTRTITATATATGTRTFTPIGGGPPPEGIPTLSFPMLALLGLGLATASFLIIRRS